MTTDRGRGYRGWRISACRRRFSSASANHIPAPTDSGGRFSKHPIHCGLAASLGDNGGVSYVDAALAILLSRDEERARWFVEHELRDLAS